MMANKHSPALDTGVLTWPDFCYTETPRSLSGAQYPCVDLRALEVFSR